MRLFSYSAVKQIVLLCAVLTSANLSADSPLDEYFNPPEYQGHSVLVVCRYTVPDNSAEWPKVLLSGFAYAASVSTDEEIVSVGIREQDYVTRIYSVKKTDFMNFLNDRIPLNDFLRKIRISKGR